jgi:hypothetical protein
MCFVLAEKETMTYTPSEKTKLVYALLNKKLTEDDFFRQFPGSKENVHDIISELLHRGLAERNPDYVEMAVPLAYRYGISKDFLEVFNILALEPWHFRHEDIVFALGKLKDPSSVDVLAKTVHAKHPYLENDEFFALGSKSIYALENIGTQEAVRVIGTLADDENEILRTTSRKRLKNISEKGLSDASKNAAIAILASVT